MEMAHVSLARQPPHDNSLWQPFCPKLLNEWLSLLHLCGIGGVAADWVEGLHTLGYAVRYSQRQLHGVSLILRASFGEKTEFFPQILHNGRCLAEDEVSPPDDGWKLDRESAFFSLVVFHRSCRVFGLSAHVIVRDSSFFEHQSDKLAPSHAGRKVPVDQFPFWSSHCH